MTLSLVLDHHSVVTRAFCLAVIEEMSLRESTQWLPVILANIAHQMSRPDGQWVQSWAMLAQSPEQLVQELREIADHSEALQALSLFEGILSSRQVLAVVSETLMIRPTPQERTAWIRAAERRLDGRPCPGAA